MASIRYSCWNPSCSWFVAWLVVSSLLFAQPLTPVRESKNLPPEAIANTRTLQSLNSLPAEDWRCHFADIPHGESVALDGSGWDAVNEGQKATKGAVWYRREIVVPRTVHGYDLTGSQIRSKFRMESNGSMPKVIYANGTQVALGDDLEPILLFFSAKPGEKVVVAVKILHRADEKSFRGADFAVLTMRYRCG